MAKKLSKADFEFIERLENWIQSRKEDNNYALEQFDKLVVYLSSGGLVLTTGFVTSIITITNQTKTLTLKLSWIGFTISLIFILLSQLTSLNANKAEIKRTRQDIDEVKGVDLPRGRKLLIFRLKVFNFSTKLLNNLSLLCLLSGIVLFVLFMIKNI